MRFVSCRPSTTTQELCSASGWRGCRSAPSSTPWLSCAACCLPACLQDNLLPVSCGGQNWQGGVALTLVDSLDMLLLLNRRADIQEAIVKLRGVLNFDKDVKVGTGPGRAGRQGRQAGRAGCRLQCFVAIELLFGCQQS